MSILLQKVLQVYLISILSIKNLFFHTILPFAKINPCEIFRTSHSRKLIRTKFFKLLTRANKSKKFREFLTLRKFIRSLTEGE